MQVAELRDDKNRFPTLPSICRHKSRQIQPTSLKLLSSRFISVVCEMMVRSGSRSENLEYQAGGFSKTERWRVAEGKRPGSGSRMVLPLLLPLSLSLPLLFPDPGRDCCDETRTSPKHARQRNHAV
ncbi:hypothetical protein DBV39_03760 [Orrella marina]|uniref:Uncharacterized protein n=1 Tax=Orrella marina TaxID=2163011 RepID=A0A2R4XGN2_9BURK|nr:hypothetical protein DBV39_03760 [Orrella marina]